MGGRSRIKSGSDGCLPIRLWSFERIWKIRFFSLRAHVDPAFGRGEAFDSRLPRKVSKGQNHVTVPQTDTGGRGENPKVLERNLVKELGKMTP